MFYLVLIKYISNIFCVLNTERGIVREKPLDPKMEAAPGKVHKINLSHSAVTENTPNNKCNLTAQL